MTPVIVGNDRSNLSKYGLAWLYELEGSELYHKSEITDRFGEVFWSEVIDRMVSSTIFPRWLCELMIDDYIAYLLARVTFEDRNEPLVINLLPDFGQHFYMLFDEQRVRLHMAIAGELIYHDPASESALVCTEEMTAKTLSVFRSHDIRYHELMWQDYLRFPNGAMVIPTGVVAV